MKHIYMSFLIVILFVACGGTTTFIQKQKIIHELPLAKENNSSLIENKNIAISDESKSIALVFSSLNIGKYSLDVSNIINSYCIYNEINSSIEIIDIDSERFDKYNIGDKLNDLNIDRIIGLFTTNDYKLINDISDSNITIYLPLVNKNDIDNILLKNNIIFGAIDYEKQFNELIGYVNSNKLVNLYDNTSLGSTLSSYIQKELTVYSKEISDNNAEYLRFLENNDKLKNSTIILNTSIVKSSILLSQINSTNISENTIISSQLNYTPLLLSFTQEEDRDNIIIANSIGSLESGFVEYTQLIGNDIRYNWVNYSSLIGLEYLLYKNIDKFKEIKVDENQIIYPIKLYRVLKNNFKEIKYK
ncbi:MAG: hypothetical protein U9Q20_09065 [Campylobacterota bacterium]|nr:hypothetical protein [Campylobacterota bacterium]